MQAWLEEHGPVHAVVDGANVALFGQNWERGAFSFGQIRGVMDQLAKHHPEVHSLMVRALVLALAPAPATGTGTMADTVPDIVTLTPVVMSGHVAEPCCLHAVILSQTKHG